MPPRVYELLAGCDVILHAGDLEDPRILDSLGRIAPTYAVQGNLHWQYSTGVHDQDLPQTLTLRAAGHTLWMTHGHFNFALSVLDKFSGVAFRRSRQGVNDYLIRRLARRRPAAADIVVFGHTHLSTARWMDGVLYLNPGSIAAQAHKYREGPRMAKLTLAPDALPAHEFFDL